MRPGSANQHAVPAQRMHSLRWPVLIAQSNGWQHSLSVLAEITYVNLHRVSLEGLKKLGEFPQILAMPHSCAR